MLSPVKDASGKLIGASAIARDITERKKAEEAIRVSEERHRIALQSGKMGAWDWHLREDKVVWSDQHFIIVGLAPRQETLKGDYFMQFVHPDDQEYVWNAIRKAVDEGSNYEVEFRIIEADNKRQKWVHSYGSVVETMDGKTTRMAGVIYDTTDRKKLEQQKDEFIAIASHELKTPLTSIKIYSHILNESLQQQGGKTETAAELDHQIDLLMALMNNLLDTTKIIDGELELKVEKFNIRTLIKERMDALMVTTPLHQIKLLPGNDEMITADRERIGQVLTNLIANAVKYSPNGSEVIIESVKEENNLKISISDSGQEFRKQCCKRYLSDFFA